MLRIFLVLLWSSVLPLHTWAAERVAMVIGNSAYAHAPALPNPSNDAADMARKLEDLGFAVISGIDLDLAGMKGKIREFRTAAAQAELALFFYAGHGIQVGGVNYMLPIDADIADETALDLEAMEMDTVLKAMAGVPTLVVLLDACRDNPFEAKLARSLQRGGRTRNIALGQGLAQIDAGTGTLVAFATQPGNVALDGEGRNSPFTAGLLKHLGQPGMSITDELILVRNEVLGATGKRQRPWDSSSLTGRVVLKAAEPVEAAPERRARTLIEVDFELARSLATKDAWRAFLERHGDSGDMRVALAKREFGLHASTYTVPKGDRISKISVPGSLNYLAEVSSSGNFPSTSLVRIGNSNIGYYYKELIVNIFSKISVYELLAIKYQFDKDDSAILSNNLSIDIGGVDLVKGDMVRLIFEVGNTRNSIALISIYRNSTHIVSIARSDDGRYVYAREPDPIVR